MPSSKENEDTFTSLAEGSTDSAAVKQYYDNWAKDYDQTLNDWEYRTPADAAALICPQLSSGSRILDVGCGTGLFSAEVRQPSKRNSTASTSPTRRSQFRKSADVIAI